jgi:hypothetical protein
MVFPYHLLILTLLMEESAKKKMQTWKDDKQRLSTPCSKEG